jgi:DNA-binding Xre family transcriptional regulator
MPQSTNLIDTLKHALRAQRITYRDIAQTLELSEASIKNMFSTCNISLKRLDSICQMMGMGFTDLVRMMDENKERISHLTLEQEEELIADQKLMLVAVCVRSRLSFDEIIEQYALSKAECIKYLARLDKLKLIELLPNNRTKLLIAQDFHWIPDGPIARFYEEQIQHEFLRSHFDQDNELRLYMNGNLTDTSISLLIRRMKALASEFIDLQKQDVVAPINERPGASMVLAIRNWELSSFAELRRN